MTACDITGGSLLTEETGMASVAVATHIPEQAQPVNTVDWLLILRGVACFMVLLNHCWEWHQHEVSRLIVIHGRDFSWVFGALGAPGVWISSSSRAI